MGENMIKSLSNGVSGMRASQLKMDVVGNNVANVQTTAYKRSKPNFAEVVRQALGDQGIPSTEDPRPQEGSGVKLVSIQRVDTQGILNPTGRSLDIAIDGTGYFKVISPDDDREYYTRDGNFYINNEGIIINSLGYALEPEMTLPEDYTSFSIDEKGLITAQLNDGTEEEIGTIELYSFPAPNALLAEGNNLFSETEASGEAVSGEAGEEGFGLIKQGYLESSNVDITQEMVSMIEAQRAYSLNARTVQTADRMWEQANNLRK
ncbi:flagellar hook-basal body protein [Desulforamulus ruminis DSM 2154]|uniref:Flagellar basal-body rod protein FlgG n=2 Tax=Desulforamulus ruminis TaxID=1564 RepID=F6DNT9_DESRL|nr:flagellar hook-basal body protein [Desulforamulus ruminis DSM 2154]